MKVYLLLMLVLIASCSDDKVTSPEEKENFPLLYTAGANELFESILALRDTTAFGNFTTLNNLNIIVDDKVFNFYNYTSKDEENYFKDSPLPNTVFETDTCIAYLYKRSFYVSNTNNLSDSIMSKRATHFPLLVFWGALKYRSELAINLVGRKNTITTEAEYIGKERVDVYFLVKEFLNEPLER